MQLAPPCVMGTCLIIFLNVIVPCLFWVCRIVVIEQFISRLFCASKFWQPFSVVISCGSLTPMGVRALGARMRENWNTPLTLFGYLLFHMLASPYSSARRQSPMYMPELVYTSISSYFLLLLSPVQKSFVAPAVSADSHEQCQSKIGQKNWESILYHSGI